MSVLLIVAIAFVAVGVVLFVVKGPDLGPSDRADGSGESPGSFSSDGPPSIGGGAGGVG